MANAFRAKIESYLMLARRFSLTHPHAGEVEMPMLVPAFSSKGFRLLDFEKRKKTHRYSEMAQAFINLSPSISTSVLVSAYDIHFKYFVPPGSDIEDMIAALSYPRLVFVDSGGYELIDEFDSTENRTHNYTPEFAFGYEEYLGVLNKCFNGRKNIHLVISNFDYSSKGKRLTEQISEARSLFQDYDGVLTDFIIKPTTEKATLVDFGTFSKNDFGNLRDFDVIGVTEKELGKTLIEKAKCISLLRLKLNEAGVNAPIHVWGGLDPIVTPLLFFAGAEIFDGVSWLRYSYKNGLAICREAYSVVEPKVNVRTKLDVVRMPSCQDIILYLDALASQLQQWVDYEGRDFSMFDPSVKDHLKRAYKTLRSTVKEI